MIMKGSSSIDTQVTTTTTISSSSNSDSNSSTNTNNITPLKRNASPTVLTTDNNDGYDNDNVVDQSTHKHKILKIQQDLPQSGKPNITLETTIKHSNNNGNSVVTATPSSASSNNSSDLDSRRPQLIESPELFVSSETNKTTSTTKLSSETIRVVSTIDKDNNESMTTKPRPKFESIDPYGKYKEKFFNYKTSDEGNSMMEELSKLPPLEIDPIDENTEKATEHDLNNYNTYNLSTSFSDEKLSPILKGNTHSRTGFAYDPRLLRHKARNESHPECPERISETHAYMKETGTLQRCVLVDPPADSDIPVNYSIYTYVHSTEHISEMLKTKTYGKDIKFMNAMEERYSNDVYFNEHSFDCAVLSCENLLQICDLVCEKKIENGFALIRPPGHHAEFEEAMGFCLFNNVSIAARELQKVHGVHKILILDWDIHHGNGIQKEFYSDPNVLYISIHRYDNGDFYPKKEDADHRFVGAGKAMGKNINIAWHRNGMGDQEYIMAFHKIIMPVANEFDPDFVLVAAGFDAADGDPLGECHVTPAGFAQMTYMLKGLANGNIVLALEGGYNCDAVAKSIDACVKVLLGDPCPRILRDKPISIFGLHAIESTLNAHRPHWFSLRNTPPFIEDNYSTPLMDIIKQHHEQELFKLGFRKERTGTERIFKQSQYYLDVTVYELKHEEEDIKDTPMLVLLIPGDHFSGKGAVGGDSMNFNLQDCSVSDGYLYLIKKFRTYFNRIILIENFLDANQSFLQELPPNVHKYFFNSVIDRLNKNSNVVMVGFGAIGTTILTLLEGQDVNIPNLYWIHISNMDFAPDIDELEKNSSWWTTNARFYIKSRKNKSMGVRLSNEGQKNVYSLGRVQNGMPFPFIKSAEQVIFTTIFSKFKILSPPADFVDTLESSDDEDFDPEDFESGSGSEDSSNVMDDSSGDFDSTTDSSDSAEDHVIPHMDVDSDGSGEGDI